MCGGRDAPGPTAFPYRCTGTFRGILRLWPGHGWVLPGTGQGHAPVQSLLLRKLLRASIARCEKKLALQEALEERRMEEYRIRAAHGRRGGCARSGQVMLVNYYDPDCAPLEWNWT